MKDLKLYLGKDPIKQELSFLLVYVGLYLIVCKLNLYPFYEVGNVIYMVCGPAYAMGLSSFHQANERTGAKYKYFRTIPNGYRRYQKAYLMELSLNIARPILYCFVSWGLNEITWIGCKCQAPYMFSAVIGTMCILVSATTIVKVTAKEILSCVGFAIILLFVFLLFREWIVASLARQVLIFAGILLLNLLFLWIHLRKVKKLWIL